MPSQHMRHMDHTENICHTEGDPVSRPRPRAPGRASMSVVFTLLAIVLALGVWGVAGMGIAGKGRTRHPRLAHHFARAAHVLNGSTPRRF